MPIPVENPVVVPATAQKTYDTLWLEWSQIQAGDPNRPVRVMSTVCKVAANGQGGYDKAPESVQGAKGTLVVNDLFARCAAEPTTITLPSTLGGQGPAVTLALADVVTAYIMMTKALAEKDGVI